MCMKLSFCSNNCEPKGNSFFVDNMKYTLRDQSLITVRRGGGLQIGKVVVPKLFVPPPPQDRVKLFVPQFQYG